MGGAGDFRVLRGGKKVSPRTIHDIQAARDLLRSGRAHDALKALDEVLREHKVMPAPMPRLAPRDRTWPLWMRRS